MSNPDHSPAAEPGSEQTPEGSSVPPGPSAHAPYGNTSYGGGPYGDGPYGDPNRAPGSGTDRFYASIRRVGLSRSEDRWVGGVAGGLAERIGWDPLLVRGLLFLSFFVTGIGLVAYAIGWALLPERSDGRIHLQQATRGDFDIALLGAGLALITGLSQADGVGLWLGGWGNWGWLVSLFWIAVWVAVAWLLVRYLRDRRQNRVPGRGPAYTAADHQGPAGYPAAPTQGTFPVPPPSPEPSTVPYGDPRAAAAYAKAEAKVDAGRARAQAAREAAQARAAAAKQRAEARAAERAARPVTKSAGAGTVGAVVGLILVAGALLAAADRTGFQFPAPFDGTYDPALLWAGTALGVIGVGIIISGVRGRSSGWLGFFAIIGLVVALPWSIAVGSDEIRDVQISGGFTDWPGVDGATDVSAGTVAPRSVDEAERGFRSQFGDPTIDLSGLDLSEATGDGPVEVPIQMTAGDLTVVVPRDIPVEADVRLLAGQVLWRVDGGEQTVNRVGSGTVHLRSDQAIDDDAVLRLLVSAGAGNVTVEEG